MGARAPLVHYPNPHDARALIRSFAQLSGELRSGPVASRSPLIRPMRRLLHPAGGTTQQRRCSEACYATDAEQPTIAQLHLPRWPCMHSS